MLDEFVEAARDELVLPIEPRNERFGAGPVIQAKLAPGPILAKRQNPLKSFPALVQLAEQRRMRRQDGAAVVLERIRPERMEITPYFHSVWRRDDDLGTTTQAMDSLEGLGQRQPKVGLDLQGGFWGFDRGSGRKPDDFPQLIVTKRHNETDCAQNRPITGNSWGEATR